MWYSGSPIIFNRNEESKELSMTRNLSDPLQVLDNWVDTIIFTAIRRFKADEDFGFSFWDNEFIAMNLNDFNNGVDYTIVQDRNNRIERLQMSTAGVKVCERSILNSLNYYVPYLKDVSVSVSLSYERDKTTIIRKSEKSKYVVRVIVDGRTIFDEYSGTREGEYHKAATFFMDPFLNNK